MPSCRPSAYPRIRAMGVLSSWVTLERKSCLISSWRFRRSRSRCRSLLAVRRAEIVSSSFCESSFILRPRISSSVRLPPPYFALKSSCFILTEISVSCRMGSVILRDSHQAMKVPPMARSRPTKARKRLVAAALLRISARGVRNKKKLLSPSGPHISMLFDRARLSRTTLIV